MANPRSPQSPVSVRAANLMRPPHSPGGFFLEIRFDEPGRPRGPVDPEFQNKVLTVDSAFGNVVIQFDEAGQLRSLDLS